MIEANPLRSEYAQQRLERERRMELIAQAAKARMLRDAFPRQPGWLTRLFQKIFRPKPQVPPVIEPQSGAVARPVFQAK